MTEYKINRKGELLVRKYGFDHGYWAKPDAQSRRAIRKLLKGKGLSVQEPQWFVEIDTAQDCVRVSISCESRQSIIIGQVPNTVDAPLTPAERRAITRENGKVLATAFRDRVVYGKDLGKPNFELSRPQIPNPIFSDELATLRAVAEDRAADLNALF